MIFGNMLAAAIAVIFNYLSDPEYLDVIPDWLSVALAPATSIAAMQVCGVLHPPAGAASLIFISAGKRITGLGWVYLLTPLLLGNVICLFCGALINNVHTKRQFPMYW